MKAIVLTGSAHKSGTSSLMAERFIDGMKENGHEVLRFDGAYKEVHPCIGCDKCVANNGICTFKDDMAELNPKLVEADIVAFVTPLYYFGMSAQIKAIIDRFYAVNDKLRAKNKKSVLIVTAGDEQEHIVSGVKGSYEELLSYLHWEDCGSIFALNCYTREDIEKTDYPEKAYKLGRSM